MDAIMIFITLLLVVFALQGQAQKYFEHNLTKHRLYSTGFDAVNNQVRWQINGQDSLTRFNELITCDTLILDANIILTCDTTYLPYKVADVDTSGLVYVPDLWSDLDGMQVEVSDIDLSGRVVLYNFGLGVIIRRNLS